jgi:hypothetical protein
VRVTDVRVPAAPAVDAMAAPQEETLLSRCEIPIIDLAHIGEHLLLRYPTEKLA